MPEPEPPRKMIPSRRIQSRIESIESSIERMKHARALRALLEADVEPDRRVEGGELVDEDRLQLGLEGLRLLLVREVAAVAPPGAGRLDDPADHLPDARLALRRGHAPAEVLLGDDVRGRLRPELRELDALLLEHRAVLPRDERVPDLPLDLVERVAAGDREVPPDAAAPCRVRDAVHERLVLDDGCDTGARCRRHDLPPRVSVVLRSTAVPAERGTREGRAGVGRSRAGSRATLDTACE